MALAAALVVTGSLAIPSGGGATPIPAVRTVAGVGSSGTLSSPHGIALDRTGDLFIADTNRCRVVVVPNRSGTLYGLHVRAHHVSTLAGTGCGGSHSLGFPTGVAVDRRGDVFVAEASEQRIQVIRPGSHAVVTLAGTGMAGYNGEGLAARASQLDQPTGIAVDAAGTLFIADTANCRLRVMPATSGVYFGRSMLAQHLYTIAGTGVCGSAQRNGTAVAAQLWNPVAVAIDQAGDLFIADNGDQSLLEMPVQSGTDYGTPIGAGGIGTVVGAAGNGNGPYLQDGLPANFASAELNDPEGVAVSPTGTLFITNGNMHCLRVVPSTTSTVFGRSMKGGDMYTLAGALPINTPTGTGNGTRWVLGHVGVPLGITLSPSGAVLFSDRGTQQVRDDRMTSIDRRTFLAHGVRASAAVAAAGALPGISAEASASAPLRTAPTPLRTVTTSSSATDLVADDLTVNGIADPLGVDPDACFFAWTLHSSDRGARQRGYRLTVSRADPTRAGVSWDSGPVTSARQAFIPYGGSPLTGDAAYAWTVEVQDGAGQWSRPAPMGRFVTMPRAADWTARWLHPNANSQQPDRVTYVRAVVTPPTGTLDRATAFISAAHTYRLFVDNQRVDSGPSFSYPDEQYVRSVDLTALLHPGRPAALGVLHRWYGAGQGRPLSAPGLLLQVSLFYADGRQVTYGTDGTWRELPAEWLPSPERNGDGADFVEWIDGQAHPENWATPGFDASGWTPASVLGPAGTAPFTTLYAQRTRIDEHLVAPIRLQTLANGSVVADFGAVYAARPRVHFRVGESGRTVPMHVGYLLDPDGQVSTTHGTQGTNLSFTYITRQGSQTFEPLTFVGFRYLQIDGPGESLGPDQVVAVATHAAMPGTPTATFATGNHTLDSVWKLNTHSCLYCTHEQFVDTPTREKGQFVWDSANESEAVMRAYGDQNMSWQGLRDVARGQARFWPDGRVNAVYPNGDGARDIPTFTERFPEWVWRYYVATGDGDTAVALYPATTRVADYLWSARDSATGLLGGFAFGNNGDPVFGYDQNVSLDTTSNVLGVNAFNRVAQLALVAGDPAVAATQRARAAQLTASVNSHLVPRGRDLHRWPAAQRRTELPCLPGGQCPGSGLRGRASGTSGDRRGLRGPSRPLRRTHPRPRAPARSGQRRPLGRHGAHPDRRQRSRVGPHPGLRRNVHLGDVDAERSRRRLHVARLGFLCPGRHAGVPPRRHPATTSERWRGHRRHHPAEDGPGGGPWHCPDHRRSHRRHLEPGSNGDLALGRPPTQHVGPDLAPRRQSGGRAGERHGPRPCRRRHRRVGPRRGRGAQCGQWLVPIHLLVNLTGLLTQAAQTVPDGGAPPPRRYVST